MTRLCLCLQQKPNINSVHLIGGALCFGGGSIYGFTQSWISYKLSPQYCSLLTCRLRLWASIFTAVFIITSIHLKFYIRHDCIAYQSKGFDTFLFLVFCFLWKCRGRAVKSMHRIQTLVFLISRVCGFELPRKTHSSFGWDAKHLVSCVV